MCVCVCVCVCVNVVVDVVVDVGVWMWVRVRNVFGSTKKSELASSVSNRRMCERRCCRQARVLID